MVSRTPKEDPQAKADRERDRRLATLDRRDSAQQEADDMTTDLRSVYGLSALSMFGRSGTKPTPRPAAPRPAANSMFNSGRRNSSDRDR